MTATRALLTTTMPTAWWKYSSWRDGPRYGYLIESTQGHGHQLTVHLDTVNWTKDRSESHAPLNHHSISSHVTTLAFTAGRNLLDDFQFSCMRWAWLRKWMWSKSCGATSNVGLLYNSLACCVGAFKCFFWRKAWVTAIHDSMDYNKMWHAPGPTSLPALQIHTVWLAEGRKQLTCLHTWLYWRQITKLNFSAWSLYVSSGSYLSHLVNLVEI
jgi:hypothetical protein